MRFWNWIAQLYLLLCALLVKLSRCYPKVQKSVPIASRISTDTEHILAVPILGGICQSILSWFFHDRLAILYMAEATEMDLQYNMLTWLYNYSPLCWV